LGWIVGRNLQIDLRWGMGDAERQGAAALEMLQLAPEVILVNPVQGLAKLKQATQTIPIVFVSVSEPVAQGFVASLAHPGGNISGFSFLEATVGTKWLGLLKEVAPAVTRVVVLVNPETNPFRLKRS
jgi:putative ABC transport system substrate-binding protein